MKKLIAFAIAIGCAATLAAQQRAESSEASPVLGRERIRTEIPITTREGVRTLQVTQRNWSLAGGTAAIPDSGFVVVQLHSGEVVTTIDGNRQKRKPGEWWTVPDGAKWSVQVTSEMAVLHVTGISAPR